MTEQRQTTPWEQAIAQIDDTPQPATPTAHQHLPPFIPLGYNGKAYIYWIRRSETLVELTPERHNRNNIIHLAPRHYWKELLGEKWTYEDAVEHCYQINGNTKYTPDRIRGIGFWDENGTTILHAGNKCYIEQNGEITETDNIRPNQTIYRTTSAVCEPAKEPLTDQEGKHIIEQLETHAWREQNGGLILSGLIVQGLLAGCMDTRAHGWINAPAGAGKTELKNLITTLLGDLPIQFEGAESTEAAIRQTIGDGARLILFDEAEHTADSRKNNAMTGVISYLRSCFKGGEIAKGGKDGHAKRYLAKSSFILFSINNTLKREADMSRFCVLRLKKLQGAPLTNLLEKQRTLRQQNKQITSGKIVARLLKLTKTIKQNTETIKNHLIGQNIKGRRAELYGAILAGAYALYNKKQITQTELVEYGNLVKQNEQTNDTEEDSTRCINHLLETCHQRENKTIHQIINKAADNHHPEQTYHKNILLQYSLGIVTKMNARYLFIASDNPLLSRTYAGTDWENGWRGTLLNLEGATTSQNRLLPNTNPKRGVLIPWKHIFENEPSPTTPPLNSAP